MDSAIDTESIIQDLRTKKKTDILNSILEEVENDDDVVSERPELGDDINTSTFDLPPNQEIALNYEIPGQGTYNVIFIRIANLLNNGISPNIGIFGKSQRGKSETALYILHTLHNDLNLLRGNFNPADQVIYGVIPFLLFYRYNARVGALFEEAGETLNKNKYNTKMNHAVAGTLRTQGKKQIPNLFVTPEASELDPRIRDNIDIEIEMVSTGKAKITFYERIHGKKAEAQRRNYEFGRVNGRWKVPRPPKRIRAEYDKIDSGFKGRYLDELLIKAINEKIEEEEQNKVMEF